MIFGTAAPKFIYNTNVVLLDKAKILSDQPLYNFIEQPSVINGFINHIHEGYHWIYVVRIHVFKERESIAKANELLSYLGKDVFLYRHREAYPFRDKDGNDLLFRIQEVTSSFFNTPDFKDIIDVKFKSTNYVDLTKSILPEKVRINPESGMVRIGKDGKFRQGY